jgi:hypothetical protein
MPPTPPPQTPDTQPHINAMPKEAQHSHRPKASVGPTIGIVIIVILLIFGALYFWGAKLNSEDQNQPLPLIPGDSTSTY